MWAEPLPCIDSASTSPLNAPALIGRRTTRRVRYGCPLAVPETKYSFNSYLKAASPLPGGSDGVESKIGPGPVISADSAGIVTAVGDDGRLTVTAGPRPPPCPPPGPPGPPGPCPATRSGDHAPATSTSAPTVTAILFMSSAPLSFGHPGGSRTRLTPRPETTGMVSMAMAVAKPERK